MITTSLPATPLLPSWPPYLRSGWIVLLLVAAPALRSPAADASPTTERPLLQFAFSRSMFAEVNENDAKAAMKVYSKSIGDENGIDSGDGPLLLDGTLEIAQAIQHQKVDMLSLTTEEFFALEDQGLGGPLIIARINHSCTEEYVLLARDDGRVRKVEDLPGRSLIVSSDIRASLATLWLEVLCREHGLGPAGQVFAKITPAAKATQVVLPVFFGKADACIVTRNGWEVMGEMNPQVKKQLREIAASPPLVPALTCFRRGFSEALKQRVIAAAASSQAKPSFKQLMALFKTDDLGEQPVAALATTRELVLRYHQLCPGTNDAKAIVPETRLPLAAAEGKGN